MEMLPALLTGKMPWTQTQTTSSLLLKQSWKAGTIDSLTSQLSPPLTQTTILKGNSKEFYRNMENFPAYNQRCSGCETPNSASGRKSVQYQFQRNLLHGIFLVRHPHQHILSGFKRQHYVLRFYDDMSSFSRSTIQDQQRIDFSFFPIFLWNFPSLRFFFPEKKEIEGSLFHRICISHRKPWRSFNTVLVLVIHSLQISKIGIQFKNLVFRMNFSNRIISLKECA